MFKAEGHLGITDETEVSSGECDGISCAHWKAAPEVEGWRKLRKKIIK